jgi:fluoroacetyl-CoA thioesterase
MKDIPLGATGVFRLTVEPEHLANRFKNPLLPAILATPVLVMAMENAALNAIEAYLEPDESALGTRIDVSDMASTPLGMVVFAEASVTIGLYRAALTTTVKHEPRPSAERTSTRCPSKSAACLTM